MVCAISFIFDRVITALDCIYIYIYIYIYIERERERETERGRNTNIYINVISPLSNWTASGFGFHLLTVYNFHSSF